MKRGLCRAGSMPLRSESSRQHARYRATRPWTTEARRGRAPGVERPSNHGVRLQSAPLQAADNASRFLGSASIERRTGIEGSLWVGAAMPAHEKIKRVGLPAPTRRTQALAIEGHCQIGIGGQAASAQLV